VPDSRDDGSRRDFATAFQAVVDNVERVVRGRTETVSPSLTCLFSSGHLIVENAVGLTLAGV
jgi:MoxR-like ATPase